MKILIVGPAWIGDMIMAQGLFRVLRKKYPEALIDVLAPAFTAPLLARMSEVRQFFTLPFKHGEWAFFKRLALGKSLKKNLYDQAIILPNTWKSALIPFFAGIPLRTGWRGEMRYGLLNNIYTNKHRYPLMLQRFIALSGDENNLEIHPDALKEFYPKLTASGSPAFSLQTLENKFFIQKNPSQKIIALCPGAEFGPSKRWPENYYAQAARYFLLEQHQVWLMGSAKDLLITEKINFLTENQCQNFAGKTNLGEAIDLLSLVDLVVTNDSGLMHIAAALNKKVIAFYGSTSPGFTPPLSDKAHILQIDPQHLPCRPCFQRQCPLQHHRCMKDLQPGQLVELLKTCVF